MSNSKYNYISMQFPNYYVRELHKRGKQGRLKANAFIVFFYDKEEGNSHSARFYAETWHVGKTTVNKWCKEFMEEIDRFDAYYFLNNLNKTARQNSYAKNEGGQSGQVQVDIKKAFELLNCGVSKDVGGQQVVQQVDKDINKEEEEEERAIAEEFEKIFFMYSNFSNRLGDRDKALEAYRKIRDEITIEDLLSTISKYLLDSSVKGKYNLQKFLSSKIFFSYLDRQIKVLIENEWISGRYDSRGNLFYTENNQYPFDAITLSNFLSAGKVEFVGRVV